MEEEVIKYPDMGRHLGAQLNEIGVEVTEVAYYMLDLYLDGYNDPPTRVPGADFYFFAPDDRTAREAQYIIAEYYDIEERDMNMVGSTKYQAEFNDFDDVISRQRF